ncbi:RHS repeat-associated core domain-containing protein, partial [Arenimonas sp. SCN 70-307]|uniref:RHS repeat-associated core domain-containing protein n=1 Tax=Arenimonas sp. SCN 70-307 TaxID=1660089 RepID=UPI0025C3DEC3
RERLTAWGEPADGTWSNEPGYTGHQMDAGSKMVYMQQRYYDPGIGRFLSADPMPSDMQSGWNFNRYNYAANNPFRFNDPDGRATDDPRRQPRDWRSLTARSPGSSTHLVSSGEDSGGAANAKGGNGAQGGNSARPRQPRASDGPRGGFVDIMEAKKDVGVQVAYGAGGAYRRNSDTSKDEVGLIPIGVGARGRPSVGGYASGVDLLSVGYDWGVRDAPVDMELTAGFNVLALTLGFDPGTGINLTLNASASTGAFAGAIIYFDDTLIDD